MVGLKEWWNGLDAADLRMEGGGPEGAGIVAEHSKGIRKVAQEYNTFILIRPTNPDSTRLIKQGYATKSMDIHDKSSDWGPMAGFVPADVAFNKKRPQAPSQAKGTHGAAQVVPLQLKDALLQQLESLGKIKRINGVGGAARHYKAGKIFSNYADHITFVLTRNGPDWDVAYNYNDVSNVPLMVWAYNGVPVTGDYDLWMVAPHITYLTTGGFDLSRMMAWKHSESALADRGLGEHKADSAATTFLIHLLPKLNEACNRADNPVFMHGAENRNYGFTQELDKRLAIFTPGGRATVIEWTDFATVIAEMSSRGYLPIWNIRYDGEVNDDPMFSHDARSAVPANKLEERLGKEKEVHDLVDSIFGSLDALLDSGDDLSILGKADFPKGSQDKLPAEVIEAQTRIQKVLAKAVQLTPQTVGQPDIDYVAKCLLAGETGSMQRPKEAQQIAAAQRQVQPGDALEVTADLMYLYNYWQRNGDRKRSTKMKQLADQMARERTVGFDLQGRETRR
ncbi:MAG: anthrax toxin-like adenylyl cyclase domain-containing protein [Pseudomonadales bacterium]